MGDREIEEFDEIECDHTDMKFDSKGCWHCGVERRRREKEERDAQAEDMWDHGDKE